MPGVGRLAVCLHGRGGAAPFANQIDGGFGIQLDYLRDRGYNLVGFDAGGQYEWANDNAMAKITADITYVRSTLGISDPAKKVLLIGYSMGGLTAFNYAQRNPNLVAGIIGLAPASSLADFHTGANGTPSAYIGEIDTAYGGNFAVNAVGHDPMGFAATFSTPIRLYSAVDDPTVPNSQVHTFYNAAASTRKSMTDLPGGGHTAFWSTIDNDAMNTWLEGLTW